MLNFNNIMNVNIPQHKRTKSDNNYLFKNNPKFEKDLENKNSLMKSENDNDNKNIVKNMFKEYKIKNNNDRKKLIV